MEELERHLECLHVTVDHPRTSKRAIIPVGGRQVRRPRRVHGEVTPRHTSIT